MPHRRSREPEVCIADLDRTKAVCPFHITPSAENKSFLLYKRALHLGANCTRLLALKWVPLKVGTVCLC